MSEDIKPEDGAVPAPPKPPKPPKPPVPTPPEPEPVVDVEPAPVLESEEIESDTEGRVKSPVAAALLSLVPFGLGHLYLGLYGRAVAVFAGFWAPILFLGLPLLGIFFYFFAVFDAYRQAQLINLAAREGREMPTGTFRGGLAVGVFFIVLGAVLISRRWFDFYIVRQYLHDWWPVLLVLFGVYFIYGAFREHREADGEEDLP